MNEITNRFSRNNDQRKTNDKIISLVSVEIILLKLPNNEIDRHAFIRSRCKHVLIASRYIFIIISLPKFKKDNP